MGEDILFFVKFGKKENLEQLAQSKIYISNSGQFIKLEEEQQKKGQGDKYEGRMFLPAFDVSIYNYETNELVATVGEIGLNIGFQGLSQIPVFCLTAGFIRDCSVYISHYNYTIRIAKQKIDTIKEHFNEADSGLLIKNPAAFIKDYYRIFKGDCHSGLVRYYNMAILTTDRLSFLSGVEDIKGNQKLSMTTENVYRHLFCKDNYFKEQQEYRFVASSHQIDKPKLFDTEMNSQTELFAIDDFFKGIPVFL